MPVEIIDKFKQKNGGQFPIVDSNDVHGGFYQVETIAERDAIPQQRRKDGMLCYVTNDPARNHMYQLNKGEWDRPHYIATNAVYVGSEEPSDNTVLWVDDKDEEVNNVLGDNGIINEFADAVATLDEKIKDIHYAFTKDLDAGEIPEPDFSGAHIVTTKKSKRFSMRDIRNAEAKKYGQDFLTDDEEEGGIKLPTYKAGNIDCIRIKRTDKKRYLPPFLKDGELVYCRDTKELLISDNGRYVTIGSVSGGGGGTGPGPGPNPDPDKGYIELISENNTKYKITVNNAGILQVYNTALDSVDNPTVDQSGRFAGLLVQQVYGGGARDSNTTPVSHGFIELYNSTKDPMNLKGLSVQVAENAGIWKVLPLKGEIPPFSSYLIRCQRHSNEALITTRCKISNYDIDWDILLPDKGLKVAIMIGEDPISVTNPFSDGNNAQPIPGYIDMIGAGGTEIAYVIDGYESRFGHYMNKYCAVQRTEHEGALDKNDNMLNCRSMDYRTCDVKTYGPRCTKSGSWYIYYDKIGIDYRRPNLLTVAYGQEPTTRIFTWQSVPSRFGGVKYRKVGEDKFISVASTKVAIQCEDTDVYKHTVVIKDLEPGTYEYQAGEEGRWSDLTDFVVDMYEDNKPVKFLQVTDQQGWDEREYMPWKYSADFIAKNEDFDFVMNTGDVAQNGNRAFEWRYYYEFGRPLFDDKCHMSCIGNNDRIEKKDSAPFAYYTSYENSPFKSCYSWDLGPIHFVCLNSEELINEQIAWFREDIELNKSKRWVIVYMHVSPYTIVQMSKVQAWRPVFEECGVDLVICGHNHAYSRSKPMKNEVVDEAQGTYYVMANATGYKLSGKEKPITPAPIWYGHVGYPAGPNYIMWEVTNDVVRMTSYYIDGMLPYDLYDGGPLTKKVYDTLEIPNRNLRG